MRSDPLAQLKMTGVRHENKGDMLLDKRLVHRHIEQGIVSLADYEAHMSKLPDLESNAETLDAELLDVGVKDVEAKDTGENE